MEHIRLSNAALEGNNSIYLFPEEGVIIDTGDWLPGTEKELRGELNDHGVEVADLNRIFVTHWHPDHCGLVGTLQAESGAGVYVHSADAPIVARDEQARERMDTQQRTYWKEWGMPPEQQTSLENIEGIDEEHQPTVTTIDDAETFTIGEHTLEAVHAPGHAAGLCMFEGTIEGEYVAFTGDALLPEYTPNVGGADVRVKKALAEYLDTLRAIVDADYDRAWPGHREPIADPAARAEEIIHHHEERAYRVLDVLRRRGPCDAWTVSSELFGSLEGIHVLHGPGEAYAHLEHLVDKGVVVEQESSGEAITYDLADGVDERLEAREDHWPLVS
jgi:glyoxylase-like metal-dependent hydrolase (beta-lactamase superfamily II)